MVPQLGAPFGFIVASGLFAFFLLNLSQEDFLSWGWRYPFFVAFTINVVALFARLRLVATEHFAELMEKRDLMPAPIAVLIRTQGYDIVIGAFVPLASFALFHLVTIFPLSYVGLFTDRTPGAFLLLELVGALVLAFTVMLSGVIADRVGRRNLLGACAILIAVFSFFTPMLLGGGEVGQSTFVLLGFRPARPVVRPGGRRRGIEFREPQPLHGLGPDVRPRVADRGRLCAPRGARRLRAVRPLGALRLSPVRRGLHPWRVGDQQAPRTQGPLKPERPRARPDITPHRPPCSRARRV